MADPLRVRLWIGGEKVADAQLDEGNVELLREEHLEMVARADAAGLDWLVDIEDPDADPEEAHVRFGTDTKGMVDPRGPFDLDALDARLQEILANHFPE